MVLVTAFILIQNKIICLKILLPDVLYFCCLPSTTSNFSEELWLSRRYKYYMFTPTAATFNSNHVCTIKNLRFVSTDSRSNLFILQRLYFNPCPLVVFCMNCFIVTKNYWFLNAISMKLNGGRIHGANAQVSSAFSVSYKILDLFCFAKCSVALKVSPVP